MNDPFAGAIRLCLQLAKLLATFGLTEAQAHAYSVLIWGAL